MITSTQTVQDTRPLTPQAKTDADHRESHVSSLGSPETELWGEVLLRAIEDFKTYTAYRKDPDEHPLSPKMVRSIVADGCDPEYWIFANNTGFDAVCMVLNVEPDCIRQFLKTWMRDTLDAEPSY